MARWFLFLLMTLALTGCGKGDPSTTAVKPGSQLPTGPTKTTLIDGIKPRAASVSPDGKALAVAVIDSSTLMEEARVYELKNLRMVDTVLGTKLPDLESKGTIDFVAISDGGRYVATATSRGVRVWDRGQKKIGGEIQTTKGVGAWSPITFLGGTDILAGDVNGFKFLDVGTGRTTTPLPDITHINEFKQTPDDKLLLIASSNPGLIVWDIKQGEQARVLKDAIGTKDFAITPDSKAVAWHRSQTLGIWDISTGEELGLVKTGRDGDPTWMEYLSSERFLLGIFASEIVVWDLKKKKELWTSKTGSYISIRALLPDRRRLVLETGSKVEVWDFGAMIDYWTVH